jgi:hypothetical protein
VLAGKVPALDNVGCSCAAGVINETAHDAE